MPPGARGYLLPRVDERYIWIVRWGDFQTYQKKRGKPWAPPWLMNHTRQLDDDRYLDLTAAERGLLHDLRLEFARTRLNLRLDTSRLSRRFGYRVYMSQLERLKEAGFIALCSRTVQEQFQHEFWNGSSLEVEVEEETPLPPSGNRNGRHPKHRCVGCGAEFKSERALAIHVQNVHEGPPVPFSSEEAVA